MPDLLCLPHLRTISRQDNGDHCSIAAAGILEPTVCSSCGHADFYNGIAKNINRMGRGYSFEVIRARLLFDEAAMRAGRATIRKKPRRGPQAGFGRTIAARSDVVEETADYGAHLPTLAHLLEEGYFS